MAYTFLELAKNVLEQIKRPLTEMEIWEEGKALGLSQKVQSQGATPWKTISARLYVDIRDNKSSIFTKMDRRPVRFGLKEINYDLQNVVIVKEQKQDISTGYDEKDLHPLLTYFLYSNPHFNCLTKTIRHEKSSRKPKGQNEWLHPDMVGIYFSFEEYHLTTVNVSKALNENSYKLFSFEVKKSLDFSTLREYYFQALSNSAWAHEGYLVVLVIADDNELIDEVRRLNNSFGIGLIKLDAENVEQSVILFPARVSEKIDLDTINRLVEANNDFNKFLEGVGKDIQAGKGRIARKNYDKVYDHADLQKHIVDKGIDQSKDK